MKGRGMSRKKLPTLNFSGKYELEIINNVLFIPKEVGLSHLSKKLFLVGIDRQYIQIIPEEAFVARCLRKIEGWAEGTPEEDLVHFGGSTQLTKDNSVYISSELLEFAGMGKTKSKVFVFGQIDCLEVWQVRKWEAMQKEALKETPKYLKQWEAEQLKKGSY